MEQNFIVNGYELDNNQMNLLKNDTNALVIAGAGSGKTLTILGKVNYLITKKHIEEETILLISFTNASVNDINARLNYNVFVFTFHKLAMYILDKNKFTYTICNPNTLNYIINEYLNTCEKIEQKYILNYLKLNINYKEFLKSAYYSNFCQTILTFINMYKTNNLNKEDILTKKYTKKEKRILNIIFKIYKIYLEEKRSINALDFDDLIIYATNIVKNTKLNFKYIIIDEFQDTSLIRLNLIKEIYLHEKTKIIVVGDDWQSIYHFSGCDLNIFLNFANYFDNIKEIKLLNTYRNSQELIHIASKFIEKNKEQIKKNLISKKHIINPIIFTPYTNKIKSLKNVLDYILNISKDIMILSRNNNDILTYTDNELTYDNGFISYKNNTIPYLTVHKSKGLEATYVIILNCNDTYLGFPNKIVNSSIINKLNENEKMPYAEERRLFYVAITRCKEKTFILYDKNNPSIFISELKMITKKITKTIPYFHKIK